MTARVRPAIPAGILAVIAAVAISLGAGSPLDYANPGCALNPLCDDASLPINALADGDLSAFFREQQLIGPVSEVVGAPFVAVGDGDRLGRYRAALLPCILGVALLGVTLAQLVARRGRPWWLQVLVAVGAVVNPVTVWVVRFGQPAELVGAALVAGAGLAAWRGRANWAGLLLGLAVANKLWALVAVPIVLAAMPAQWRRAAAVAAICAGVLIAIPALAAPGQFHENVVALGRIGSVPGTVAKTSIWYPATDTVEFDVPVRVDPDGVLVTQHLLGLRLSRTLARLAHALILLAGAGIAALWVARGRPGGASGALLALALVLLLRCILDPGTRSYYHEPFLLAALSYEALVRRWIPGLAIAGAAGVEGLSLAAHHVHSGGALCALYLAWTVPLAIAMGVELYRLPSGAHGARSTAHRA